MDRLLKQCRLLVFFILLAAISACSAGQTEMTMMEEKKKTAELPEGMYRNPIGPDEMRMGDPFMIKHAGGYYLYGTNAADGFKAWRSDDMVHWEHIGYVYRDDESTWGERSFWAPEVHRYRGRFYLVFSARAKDKGFRLCVASADTPEGPFKILHAPWIAEDIYNIDAHLFIDEDETPYLYFDEVGVVGNPHAKPSTGYMYGKIHAVQLKADLSGPVGDPVFCATASKAWEEPENMFSRCNEGAFVFKHGDTYYMTYSNGHWSKDNYAIGYATAPHPLGPWTKPTDTPLLAADPEKNVFGPGHSSIALSPDDSQRMIVYHTLPGKGRSGGRQVNIDPLVISEDGKLKVLGPTRAMQPLEDREED